MTVEIQNNLGELDPNAIAARQLRAAQAENRRLRGQLNAALARADKAEDIRDGVFALRDTDLVTPEWPKPGRGKAQMAHTPILFTSDFQCGEVIDPKEMDGMNKFNQRIFVERYDRMIRKTIRWSDAIAAGWGATYPNGSIYLRGGDAISNGIHLELFETNDLSAVPAARLLVSVEADGIRRMRDRFGAVHVISIPGNHGRTTLKPHHKGYVKHNFETLIAWWLQAELKGEPGITFECPESGYARFTAEGWRFEMRHGDRMGAGGGVGWIGSPAPITKGHKKIRLDAATVDDPVDFILTGHFHTSMKLPRSFANGSMPGYNEFARSLGLEPDSAKQWFLLAHVNRVYGIELELSKFPRKGAYR